MSPQCIIVNNTIIVLLPDVGRAEILFNFKELVIICTLCLK